MVLAVVVVVPSVVVPGGGLALLGRLELAPAAPPAVFVALLVVALLVVAAVVSAVVVPGARLARLGVPPSPPQPTALADLAIASPPAVVLVAILVGVRVTAVRGVVFDRAAALLRSGRRFHLVKIDGHSAGDLLSLVGM